MDIHYIGDSCISFVFTNEINRESSCSILRVYRALKKNRKIQSFYVHDLIPTYRSITFYFDPQQIDILTLEEKLIGLIHQVLSESEPASEDSETHIIPVKYDGVDLGRIAEFHSLSVSKVITLHKKPLYQVAMVGFRPYFPYLIGLDKQLITKRLFSPRTKVPAGSIAIGGAQTGIYPEESPGGWNLIGKTDPSHLKMIKPGDFIQFHESDAL